jgi:hypothetical protein
VCYPFFGSTGEKSMALRTLSSKPRLTKISSRVDMPRFPILLTGRRDVNLTAVCRTKLSSSFGRLAFTRLCSRRPTADTKWVSQLYSRPASRSERSARRPPGYVVSTWCTTGSADCFRRRCRTNCGAKTRARSSQAPTHQSARRRQSRAAICSRGDFRFPADRPARHGISAGRCCR